MTHQTNEELKNQITLVLQAVVLRSLMENKALPEHIDAMADKIMSLIPQPEQKECKWKQWSEGDTFDTDCDNCFSLIEGSIEENNFKHCPYCGKLIKVTNEPEGE